MSFLELRSRQMFHNSLLRDEELEVEMMRPVILQLLNSKPVAKVVLECAYVFPPCVWLLVIIVQNIKTILIHVRYFPKVVCVEFIFQFTLPSTQPCKTQISASPHCTDGVTVLLDIL